MSREVTVLTWRVGSPAKEETFTLAQSGNCHEIAEAVLGDSSMQYDTRQIPDGTIFRRLKTFDAAATFPNSNLSSDRFFLIALDPVSGGWTSPSPQIRQKYLTLINGSESGMSDTTNDNKQILGLRFEKETGPSFYYINIENGSIRGAIATEFPNGFDWDNFSVGLRVFYVSADTGIKVPTTNIKSDHFVITTDVPFRDVPSEQLLKFYESLSTPNVDQSVSTHPSP